jgi:uncharacterized protein YqjF (DUF2071 family)
MAGQRPEESVRRPASLQRWEAMTFLHWAYDAAIVAPLLPTELELDTWDGDAWVSITPFLMADFRLPGLPAVPGVSTFPETNVRTYVRGPGGDDGIWFLSLEADSVATVVAASTVYGVPYRWADMAVEQGEVTRYRSRRRFGPEVGHDIRVRPERPCPLPSELDHWLTGRWRAWTRIAGRLATAPVEHQPWPLWDATVVDLEQSLLSSVGLAEPEGPPLVQYSPGVDVRLGPPRLATTPQR